MFMQPEFIEDNGYSVETSEGTFYVPQEASGSINSASDLEDYVSGRIDPESLESISGVFWRLSAPGYLDCAEWSYAKTLPEAVSDCLGMFGDDDSEMVEALADIVPGFSEFWQGYLYGLAFTASEDSESGGYAPEEWQNPGGDIRDVVDTEDVERILRHIDEFANLQADCLAFYLDALPYFGDSADLESAGSDFHLTRNGHGSGFWDGDWTNGDKLTELCRPYGECELMWSLGDTVDPEGDSLDILDSYDWHIA